MKANSMTNQVNATQKNQKIQGNKTNIKIKPNSTIWILIL